MLKKFFGGLLALSTIFSAVEVEAAPVPLTLDEAIELALKNNRQIEQSVEDREMARWDLSAARRATGLTLTWNASLNRIGGRYYNSNRLAHDYYKHGGTDSNGNKINPKLYPSYGSEMSNTFSLRFNLYSGGQLENRQKAAKYALNAADMSLENSRQTIKYQTAAAYYQVLERASYVKVQQEAVRYLEEHLRNVEIQYEVGVVAKADMLSTNVQLANVYKALNTAQGNYLTAVAQLNNLMGLAANTEVSLTDEQRFLPYTLTEADCLEYALVHRPDGAAAMYAVKQAKASKEAAKAGYRPYVNALFQGSFTGEGVFKADHYQGERWSAGLELQWNIFDNGVTNAQVERAKAAERRAESQARQQLETIELEVRSAYIRLQTAKKNIETTSEAVSKAEEQFAIAQIRYVEGVDTNLHVMNAQEKVVETRNNYYSAIYDYNTSLAQLEKAIGVPVNNDTEIYVESVSKGHSSKRSLEESTVSEDTDLGIEQDKPFNK